MGPMNRTVNKFSLDLAKLGKTGRINGKSVVVIEIDDAMYTNETSVYIDFVSFEKETEFSNGYIIRSFPASSERRKNTPIVGRICKTPKKEPKKEFDLNIEF